MVNVRAFITIIRPLNAMIAFVVSVASYLIAKELPVFDYQTIILAGSVFFSIASANIVNDIFDIDIDLINRPDRVLPQKELSLRFAWIYYSALLLLSFSCAVYISPIIASLNLFANLLLFVYSKYLKRMALIGNIIVAFLTSFVFIYVGIAAKNIAPLVMFSVFSFLINLARELLKDIEDIEGDMQQGLATMPIKYGIVKSRQIVTVLLWLLICATFIPFVLKMYLIEYFVVITLLLIPLLVKQIANLSRSCTKNDYSRISKLLKFAILIGFLALLVGDDRFRQLF